MEKYTNEQIGIIQGAKTKALNNILSKCYEKGMTPSIWIVERVDSVRGHVPNTHYDVLHVNMDSIDFDSLINIHKKMKRHIESHLYGSEVVLSFDNRSATCSVKMLDPKPRQPYKFMNRNSVMPNDCTTQRRPYATMAYDTMTTSVINVLLIVAALVAIVYSWQQLNEHWRGYSNPWMSLIEMSYTKDVIIEIIKRLLF